MVFDSLTVFWRRRFSDCVVEDVLGALRPFTVRRYDVFGGYYYVVSGVWGAKS